ncbi:MAG TPA: rhomboid family intramembrane serine protease [Longimicrobiales bacterium]|jgi:membrane associated rhomboid family serine protease
MTPWVKRLLIANVVMFIISSTSPGLYRELAFWPWLRTGPETLVPGILLRPWTAVTYMFLHADLTHLLFNMIGLFFFGPRLEHHLTGRDFLKLYFLAGLGGAVFSFFFGPGNPVVGASGAVYGVLLGFAMIWPRERIWIWMILPVEAWLLATVLIAGSLWSGLSGSSSGIAHFAHLGGLAFGFAYLRFRTWRQGAGKREFQRKLEAGTGGGSVARAPLVGDRIAVQRWQAIDVEGLHELNREEVIHLLDKVKTVGIKGLTQSERQFLDRIATANGL